MKASHPAFLWGRRCRVRAPVPLVALMASALALGGCTPQATGRGGAIEVRVPDGTLEDVEGSLKARAAVWFSGLGRQTFAVSETVADATELEVGGATYRARVVAAESTGADLVFSLALAEAPRGPNRGP